MVLNRSQFENMSKEELILELTYINSSFCQRHKCETDYDNKLNKFTSKYDKVYLALLHFRTPPLPFFIDDSGAEFHAD